MSQFRFRDGEGRIFGAYPIQHCPECGEVMVISYYEPERNSAGLPMRCSDCADKDQQEKDEGPLLW